MGFKIAVLASGRGTNLQALIDAVNGGYLPAEIAVVISDKEEAMALKRAKDNGITSVYINPKNFTTKDQFEKAVLEQINNYQCNLICLAGFMRILSPFFINNAGRKIINIHPSLLPAFPGLKAQKQALEYGVKYSGCTVHFVDEGIDSGPIILQAVVPVYDFDSEESLAERILEEEHRIYPMAVKLIAEGRLQVEGRKVIVSDGS